MHAHTRARTHTHTHTHTYTHTHTHTHTHAHTHTHTHTHAHTHAHMHVQNVLSRARLHRPLQTPWSPCPGPEKDCHAVYCTIKILLVGFGNRSAHKCKDVFVHGSLSAHNLKYWYTGMYSYKDAVWCAKNNGSLACITELADNMWKDKCPAHLFFLVST